MSYKSISTYICSTCHRYVKDVDIDTARKFLNKHNKTGWTGARTYNICVTDLVSSDYLALKLAYNEAHHPKDRWIEEEVV